MDKIVNYLMKFKFVVKFVVKFGVGRTKGDIEALADARRALKKLNLSGKTSKIASSENVASEIFFIFLTGKRIDSEDSMIKWQGYEPLRYK